MSIVACVVCVCVCLCLCLSVCVNVFCVNPGQTKSIQLLPIVERKTAIAYNEAKNRSIWTCLIVSAQWNVLACNGSTNAKACHHTPSLLLTNNSLLTTRHLWTGPCFSRIWSPLDWYATILVFRYKEELVLLSPFVVRRWRNRQFNQWSKQEKKLKTFLSLFYLEWMNREGTAYT